MTDLENIVAKGYRALENAWRAWQPQRGDTGALSTVKDTGRSLPGLIDDLIAGGMVGSFGNVIDPRLGQSKVKRDAARKAANEKFLKDAAINAAAAAAGYGIGKGVQKGVKALNEAGLVNRTLNLVRGDRIITHGTGNPFEGLTEITPRRGSPGSPDEPVVFGWNTSRKGDYDTAIQNPREYSTKPYYKDGEMVPGEGNIIIGKAKKSALKQTFPDLDAVLQSTKAVKIIDRIPLGPNYEERMIAALRKAGVKAQPNPAERALIKAKKAVASKKMERQNGRGLV